VNDPVLVPAGITVGDGTVRLALLLVKATVAPPVGAAAVRVIVQFEVPAPVREAGLQATLLSCAGAAVRLTDAVVDAPFAVAVTVTGVVAETVPAVAVKAAVALAAATVTEAGTVRTALLPERATSSPPAGATLFRVKVQVVAAPDETVAGEQLSVEGTIGATRLSVAVAVVLLRLALSTAVLSTVMVDTEAVKLAVEAPAVTVTEAGVVTRALLSERAMTIPPKGAGPFSATVHAVDEAETSEVGVQVSELGVSVSVKLIEEVFVLPFNAAVTIAVWAVEMVPAVALNVPVVAPAAIDSEAGTVRIALSSDRATTLPPAGAALLNVTVQVLARPETRPVGVQSSDET
jgi:hypothetical protein